METQAKAQAEFFGGADRHCTVQMVKEKRRNFEL